MKIKQRVLGSPDGSVRHLGDGSSSGAALTGLSLNLVLPDPVTYDCEAEFTAVQYVSDAESGEVVLAQTASFGGFGSGNGQFQFPQQIAIDPNSGDIWVADYSNARAQRFSSLGVYEAKITGLTNILGVAVDSSGNIYVGFIQNPGNVASIRKYNAALAAQWTALIASPGTPAHLATVGAYVFAAISDSDDVRRVLASTGGGLIAWGSSGTGNGQFNRPWGIVTDGVDVWVGDQGNARIQRFNTSGTFETKWGSSGTGNGQFTVTGADGLRGLCHDAANGRIYVADTFGHRVQIFDEDGTYLGQFGTFGSGSGQFNAPTGIAIDAAGSLYVSDTLNHRVTKWESIAVGGTPAGGYGTVAVEIDGNLSTYTGIGQRSGSVSTGHTLSVTGPKTVVIRVFGKATTDTLILNACVLSARCVARR